MEDQEHVWESIAEKWTDFREKPLVEVVNFLKNKSGNILDLGCGSGRHFIKINGTIFGVDFSQRLLNYAKGKARKDKIKSKLIKSSADNIPFKDNFFDACIFIRVLHCIPTQEKRIKTLKEIHRVLKPGAQALIETWSKSHNRIRNKGKECMIPWTIEGRKYERYTYIYDEDELKKQLKSVGFKIKKIWADDNINIIIEK